MITKRKLQLEIESLQEDWFDIAMELVSLKGEIKLINKRLDKSKQKRPYVKSGKYSKKSKAKRNIRKWTDEQRLAHSIKMQKAWKARKEIK